MAVERRFLTGAREADTDEPGLVIEDDGTVWRVSPGGARAEVSDGGSPEGSLIPVADPAGATVDDTTYDNSWLGSGKLTTLVFPQSTAAFAIAIEGDEFPRIVYLSNPSDGVFYGDGTVNPINGGAAMWIEAGAPGEFVHVIEGGGATQLRVGVPDVITGRRQTQLPGVTLGRDAGFATILSGLGEPDLGAHVNDLYIRSDAPDVNNWLYRCTVAGTSGNATWTAVGGLT